MIKFILKQFLYGRFYFWLKSNLGRVFFLTVKIFLIFYFHSEYLKYVNLSENSDSNYIGLSFVIKNLLIIIVTISYLYFYFFLGKAVKSIESFKENTKKDNEPNRVDSLDYFLNEEEINKKN